jgi:cytochrome c
MTRWNKWGRANDGIPVALAGMVLSVFPLVSFAFAQQTIIDRGGELLSRLCSNCHAVGGKDKSRHPSAPPFRQIMSRYKAEMLAEALAEGLSTGHSDMPEFTFEPEQISAIIEYLDRRAKEQR